MQVQLHYTSGSTQLQFRHITTTTPATAALRHIHAAVVGEVTDQVTTATIVTIPRSATPSTLKSISWFALQSVIHSNQALPKVSYFETSATALCGTTGLE